MFKSIFALFLSFVKKISNGDTNLLSWSMLYITATCIINNTIKYEFCKLANFWIDPVHVKLQIIDVTNRRNTVNFWFNIKANQKKHRPNHINYCFISVTQRRMTRYIPRALAWRYATQYNHYMHTIYKVCASI
jgi:hypothetical protein